MSQRTWFITGSFGRHMSEQLLERGDRVAGTARKLEGVDDLLEKISWRPLAISDPAREKKRKADMLALKLSMADIWPGGQFKWCSAFPRFDAG